LYICGNMKKILYYFIIASALFLTKTVFALDATSKLSFTTTQQVTTVHYCPLSSNSLFFDDIILEEVTDDDESNESERKKKSSLQNNYSTCSIITQNFPKNEFNKIFPSHLSFPLRTSLFIFICVLRL
jgi:hypothetical protein